MVPFEDTALIEVDDSVIDKMILNEQERKLKTRLWNNLHKDWIVEQKEKKRKQKEIEK